jgi:hypothetical protein
MKKIEKQKGVRVNDFAKRYGLKWYVRIRC